MKRTIRNAALAAMTLLAVTPAWGDTDDLAPPAKGASATVPIGEYLDLRKKNEVPSVTTVEEIYLSGVYGKELALQFSGTASGQPQAKPVFDYTDAFSLHDCAGDAMFDLAEGSVSILPLGKRFKLSCKVSVKNWAELEMNLKNALFFRANVAGAEVITDSTEPGSRKVILSHGRRATAQADADITATGRYLVTAMPDDTRFSYVITATNPNRGIKPFDIHWPNGERVQKIHTTAEYSESDDGMTVKLPPGDTSIIVQGSLSGQKFEPPLHSEHQFVMIENHPTLQLAIDTEARRVGPRDAQMAQSFPSARAYLAGKEAKFSWTTKKLELFSTLGYSVKNANYLYYVPENGKGIVEAHFQFDNQGTPEIPLEVPGTATYLEINGVPQVLYKNADGKLVLQLGTGVQNVLLQYRTEQIHRGLASAMSIDLARPHSVLSNTTLQLRTPDKWSLLFGGGLHHLAWDYSVQGLVMAFLAALLTGWLLSSAGFEKRARWFVAGAIGFILFVNPSLVLLWIYTAVGAVLIRHRAVLFQFARKHAVISTVLTGGALFAMLVGSAFIHSVTRFDRGMGIQNMVSNAKSAAMNYDRERDEAADVSLGQAQAPSPARVAKPKLKPGAGGGADDKDGDTVDQVQGTFQGLPARIEIPNDGQTHYFSQGLIDEKGQIRLSAVMLGMSVIGALCTLLAALSSVTLFKRRTLLVRALRFG
jgi:hypothetical protein